MNDSSDKTIFSKIDIIFALVMLVCGFLFWNLIRLPHLGAGVTLFSLIFCLCTFFYLQAAGFRQKGTSLVCLVIIVLSTLVFLLFDNTLIKVLNFIFLLVIVGYWISLSTGITLKKEISAYMIGDFIHQFLVIPFCNFVCCFRALKALITENKKGKSIWAGAFGILIILPILVLVVNLLVEADAAFAELVANLHFSVSLDIILQVIMGIPVACYLYGLIYGCRYQRNTNHLTVEAADSVASACRLAPAVTVYSALTALNLVYIVFFLSQLTYLFSAFTNQLPELMTYAEYARRGFFELCAVAGINLVIITVAYLLVKREKIKILRAETAVLSIFTLILIITAVSKMMMYINYYGLTQLRVYTTWFMIMLFLIFTVLLIRQFKKFNAAKVIVLGFIILFFGLCYSNVDGRIAAYNINRYKNGTLETLDIQALTRLSDAAVPYMYDLYQHTQDQSLKADLKAAMEKNFGSVGSLPPHRTTFRDFNYQHYTAQNIKNMLSKP